MEDIERAHNFFKEEADAGLSWNISDIFSIKDSVVFNSLFIQTMAQVDMNIVASHSFNIELSRSKDFSMVIEIILEKTVSEHLKRKSIFYLLEKISYKKFAFGCGFSFEFDNFDFSV